MSEPLKLSATVQPGPRRNRLLALVRGKSRPTRWGGLPADLHEVLDGFERFQVGALVARLSGADAVEVDGLQEERAVVALNRLFARLPPALQARFVHRLREDGVLMVHHHVIRELAAHAHEPSDLFAASGACQLAAIGLDAQVRRVFHEDDAPSLLVAARDEAVAEVARRVPLDSVPLGGLALSVLWAALLARLGRTRLEDETTEHYA